MIVLPPIDPIALQLGPLPIRWYSLSWLIGFGLVWWLCVRYSLPKMRGWTGRDVENLVFFGFFGVFVGSRIGYVLFYNLPYYLDNPLSAFRVWDGGLSFHGGLAGCTLCIYLWAKRTGRQFLFAADFGTQWLPLPLFCVRIGNFINGELWGRPTDLPWGVVFANDPTGLARHPSQLYEAVLEGLVLFAIVQWTARRASKNGTISAVFLIGYGSFRILVELVREPDAHIGFDLLGWVTRGQVLSLPVLLFGLGALLWLRFNGTPRRPLLN